MVGAVAFSMAVWLTQRRVEGQRGEFDRANQLDEVIEYVSSVYVDSVTQPDLYELAIDGMLRELGDPYTDYLAEDEFRALSTSATGNYVGIGVRIESSDGLITVVTPLAGTPAEDAGMLPGDRIIEIDGQVTLGWTTDEVASILRGSEGQPVRMVVARPGTRVPLNFQLVRTSIHVNSVRHAELLNDNVGYVWLETVSENSAEELREHIANLRAEGAEELLLDLRSNPGGLLTEAIAISDLFLDPGDVVVETRGRDERLTRTYEASSEEPWPDMPLVVLVNEFSASAAEIIAGAIQDHDRGLLIGAPTFGKGLVQTVFPFGRDRALKITTGRWYTPLGRSIQRSDVGELIALGDSTAQNLDTVQTDGGQTIFRGGGIQPDIHAETAIQDGGERLFVTALRGNVQEFRDAVSAFAIRTRAESTLTDPDFSVSAEMREDLRQHLSEQGMRVSNSVWRAAMSYIDREVSYRLLRYVFGTEAELTRRTADDVVVSAAVRLLNEIETTSELLEAGRRR